MTESSHNLPLPLGDAFRDFGRAEKKLRKRCNAWTMRELARYSRRLGPLLVRLDCSGGRTVVEVETAEYVYRFTHDDSWILNRETGTHETEAPELLRPSFLSHIIALEAETNLNGLALVECHAAAHNGVVL